VKMTAPQSGSRASGPGSRPGSGWTILLVVLIVAAGAVAAYSFWPSSAPSRPAASRPGPGSGSGKYGGLPSWLPKSTVKVGRVVSASAAHPKLAIQGDTVAVTLADGHVLATAVGPVVPEEGEFPVPATSPCSFTVTFTQAAGVVPVSPGTFTILDEQGQLHHPKVIARGGGKAPATVGQGKTTNIVIKAVLPTGSGELRWSPGPGKPVVSWDFDIEID
jgi:hypothetical protein